MAASMRPPRYSTERQQKMNEKENSSAGETCNELDYGYNFCSLSVKFHEFMMIWFTLKGEQSCLFIFFSVLSC